MTSKATAAQWDEAREIAVRHVDATFHLPADKVRAANPRLPFLFTAALPGKSAVLVHEAKVLDGGGLTALGTYLDAVDVYADGALVADDVLDLVYVFDAFPAVDPAAGSANYYVTDEGTDLSMRATWKGHDLDFTLAYRLQIDGDGGDEGEPDDNNGVMTISFWTLHLRKGAVPSWTEERREQPYKREPVDD